MQNSIIKRIMKLEAECDFIEVHAVTEDGTKTLIDRVGEK